MHPDTELVRRAFIHTLKTGAPGISETMRAALWIAFVRRVEHEIKLASAS